MQFKYENRLRSLLVGILHMCIGIFFGYLSFFNKNNETNIKEFSFFLK